jgi:hypothetical protein
MSQATTLILLPQTTFVGVPVPNTTVTGNAFPAASYYLSSQDLQTVSWAVTSFKGIITIQSSLLDNPMSDNDWFTTFNVVYSDLAGTTINSFHNITGNFLWIRAIINNFTAGTVEHVKVSY